jgi:hypothetical protein
VRQIAVILTLFWSASAYANADAEVECGLAQKGTVQVDGLLDDWQGVNGLERHGDDARDAGFTFRCNYDDDTLYVSLDVHDERVIRRKRGDRGAEDTVAITIGKDKLIVLPAYADSGAVAKYSWNGGAISRKSGIAVADSLQKVGFSVEASIPFARLRSYGKDVPTLPLAVEFDDADQLHDTKFDEKITTGDARLTFAEGEQLYHQFLDDLKLKPKDVQIDMMANMDGEPGDERVLIAGYIVGVLSDQYYYMKIPAKPKDILAVKVVDLAGEGKFAIVAHYIEYGDGGSREVVAVWNLLRDHSFPIVWAHEVAKKQGKNKITNSWELAPKMVGKGKRQKKVPGQDIIVKVGDAVGWTSDTWNESPAEDMNPILLPWGDKKIEHWHFRGDESYGGE